MGQPGGGWGPDPLLGSTGTREVPTRRGRARGQTPAGQGVVAGKHQEPWSGTERIQSRSLSHHRQKGLLGSPNKVGAAAAAQGRRSQDDTRLSRHTPGVKS